MLSKMSPSRGKAPFSWGELEDERAYALFKNLQVFDDETSRRLLLAAAELRRLVLENLEKSAGK